MAVKVNEGSRAAGQGQGNRLGRFILLQLLNILALFAAIAALVALYDHYERAESVGRATEVAQYELRRMRGVFNQRLNELRDELVHLYGEQMNLARALSESERERLVFYRRDHLAGYAILVPGEEGKWEVQKYYMRETAGKAGAQPDEIIRNFKEAMASVTPSGFGLKRVTVEAERLGAPWQGQGQSGSGDAVAVAFLSNDDSGKPFGVVGFFKSSYVFPFCRAFGDTLGEMPVAGFILNDKGVAICHSSANSEGTSFKDYSFYATIKAATSDAKHESVARYTNLLDNNVSAAVRRIEPGGLIFVSEAAEVSPWAVTVPYRELAIVGAVFTLVMLVLAILMARLALGGQNAEDQGEKKAGSGKPGSVDAGSGAARLIGPGQTGSSQSGRPERAETMPATDGLGVELNEFSKLRRELKDLENTVLEMQSSDAFMAGFQNTLCELPAHENLTKAALAYLGSLGAPMLWLSFDPSGGKFHSGTRVNWNLAKAQEPAAGFQISVEAGVSPRSLAGNEALLKKLGTMLGRSDLALHPVCFRDELLGAIVLAGMQAGEQAAKFELIPQLAQTLAYVLRARGAEAGS